MTEFVWILSCPRITDQLEPTSEVEGEGEKKARKGVRG